MRRGSSTVVALVGQVPGDTIRSLARSTNVVVVEPEGDGFDAAVAAFSRATGSLSPYVLVAADPLGDAAAEWQAMWDLSRGSREFEVRAGVAIAVWRAGGFELPDYYLVAARERATETAPHPHDFHLGVLKSERPSRVVPVVSAGSGGDAMRILDALTSLQQGPWWPPLDRLFEGARSFFPGGLAG